MNSVLLAVWAAAPILLYMILFLFLRVKPLTAAAVSFGAAVLTGVLAFGMRADALLEECAKGAWNAFAIFYVVFAALFFYEALVAADMFTHIRFEMQRFIQDRTLLVFFIGWGFSSFLQGITGFGVPAAVTAPILVGLGIPAFNAVLISILGHAWGGTFGTLAIAWDNMLLQAGIGAADAVGIAVMTGVMLWAYNFICGLLICVILKGKKVRARELACAAVVSLVQGGGQLALVRVNTTTACFFASALSLAAILLLDRFLSEKSDARPAREKGNMVFRIAAPYLFLLVLALVLLFIPGINAAASSVKIGPVFDGVMYSPLSVFTHSGTLLMATGIFTFAFYRKTGHIQPQKFAGSLNKALKKAVLSSLSILCLIMMSRVMDGAGHIEVLSSGAIALFGAAYPLISPFIGMLGAFISSSNMSSNILFTGFQKNAAMLIGADQGLMLAAQTSGGSVGNLLATSNAVMGAATTGLAGQESRIMRRLFPIALVCGFVCSLIVAAYSF